MQKPTEILRWGVGGGVGGEERHRKTLRDYFHGLVNVLPVLCPYGKHVPRKIN